MKKYAAALILLGALALTGCGGVGGSPEEPATVGSTGGGWYAANIKLPDGSYVTCVATYGGGVDCDWDGRE